MSVREQKDAQLYDIVTKTVIVPRSPMIMKKSSNENLNYKVLGRVLTASLCVFMLLEDEHCGGTIQKDYHLGLSAAIVCGMISGIALNVGVLIKDHSLKISTTKENMCYLIVLLDFFVLCTVVPGGQTFIACLMVYGVLIKGKADTCKDLIIAIGVYSLWIYVAWKGCLSVDWLFVALTVVISTLWSILNDRFFHMDDTYVNQFKIPIIVLMANFISFDYDRFIAPALIMVAQLFTYAMTKTICKMQSWYITSKQEDLFAKNYLTIELFTILGAIEWVLAYIFMLWEGVRLGIATWPMSVGTYMLAWEFLDICLDYFNESGYTRKKKRMLYIVWLPFDIGLHLLFIYYGYGLEMPTDEFGLGTLQTVQSRFLYVAALIGMWIVVCVVCSRFGLGRHMKYSCGAIECIVQSSLVRLPAYASSPLMTTAAWATVLGNALYVPRIWSNTFPKPKIVFFFFVIGLPVVSVLCIIFHHEIHAIPASQYSLITSLWLTVIVVNLIYCWWKTKLASYTSLYYNGLS